MEGGAEGEGGQDSNYDYNYLITIQGNRMCTLHALLPAGIVCCKKSEFVPCPFRLTEEMLKSSTTVEDVRSTVMNFPILYPVFIETPKLLCVLTCKINENELDRVRKQAKKQSLPVAEIEKLCDKLRESKWNSYGGMEWRLNMSSQAAITYYKYILYTMEDQALSSEKHQYDEVRRGEKKLREECENQMKKKFEQEVLIQMFIDNIIDGSMINSSRAECSALLNNDSINVLRNADQDNIRAYIQFLETEIMRILDFSIISKQKLANNVKVVPFEKVRRKQRLTFLTEKYRNIISTDTEFSVKRVKEMVSFNIDNPELYPNSYDYASIINRLYQKN